MTNKTNRTHAVKLAEIAAGVMGTDAASLRQMAATAWEHRTNADAMKVFGSVWGRNARILARAVSRFPSWFDSPLGNRNFRDPTADQYLALFALCVLPAEACQSLYQEFQKQRLESWQVRERAKLWLEREREHERELRGDVDLDLRAATLSYLRSKQMGGTGWRNTVRVTWQTDDGPADLGALAGKPVDVRIRPSRPVKGKANA